MTSLVIAWLSSSGYLIDGEPLFAEDEYVSKDAKLERANIWATMKANEHRVSQWIRDSELRLATWEIKSLGTGASEVMSKVLIWAHFLGRPTLLSIATKFLDIVKNGRGSRM